MNQSQYSLVLSDFRIPEMDGIQLLKEIKAIKPSVKTLLVSAFLRLKMSYFNNVVVLIPFFKSQLV